MSQHHKPIIKVVQYMYGDFEYFVWSEKINRHYCNRHGYEYVISHETPRTDRHVNWHKVEVILQECRDCDYLLFIDADAYFYSQELSIESELLSLFGDKKFILAQDCVMETSRWRFGLTNTGVLFMKVDQEVRELLAVWNRTSESNEKWRWTPHHEQSAFDEEILHQYESLVELIKDYYLINSPLSIYIRHYMGLPNEFRNEKIKEFHQERFGKNIILPRT